MGKVFAIINLQIAYQLKTEFGLRKKSKKVYFSTYLFHVT